MENEYDVVIIGGGAAGLSAALTLSRARRRVLVVDAGHPRNAPAGHVHNYLGRESTPPGDLLAIGRSEVMGYGGEIRNGIVTAVHPRSDAPERPRFAVELADGTGVAARRVLVTTGLTDELPDIPGVAEHWGSRVLHCPYCHGWEVRDRPVAILGLSPMSAHQALLWRQWTPTSPCCCTPVRRRPRTSWRGSPGAASGSSRARSPASAPTGPGSPTARSCRSTPWS
ncbi:NAD(P)/FAD-dependent oxidoreductase [Dactylosporangium cerinum]